MDKSLLKYLLGGWFIFGGETFATLMDSDPRENLVTMLSQQSLPMLLLFQRIVDCLGSLPGTDEVKESAMGRFLETDLETNRERLKSMVAEEEKMVAKEKRIQALKAQFEKEFEEKDEEIRGIWGSLDVWGEICGDIDKSADEITEQFLNLPKVKPIFFSGLCQRWKALLERSNPEQRKTIIDHNGFRYSLAIMLIHASSSFPGDLSPLEGLWRLFEESLGEEKEDFVCNFEDSESMKTVGIKIMKSAKSYNLAYVYLGSEAENGKED